MGENSFKLKAKLTCYNKENVREYLKQDDFEQVILKPGEFDVFK